MTTPARRETAGSNCTAEPVAELVERFLYRLCDATALFPEPFERAFPSTQRHQSAWLLHSHCYLAIERDRPLLIDTGVGPRGSPAASWLGVDGRLPDRLRQLGISAADVRAVVLTHLHLDHVGWNVDPVAGTPFFPNAEYVVQHDELAAARRTSTGPGDTYARLVAPLDAAGSVRPVDGTQSLAPGVTLFRTPGHSVGHQSVAIERRRSAVLLAGDAFVHPVQLDTPEVTYAYETDPAVAAESRRALLARARASHAVIAPAHFDLVTQP